MEGQVSGNAKSGGFDVTSVFPDGAAAKGGVLAGDTITKIAGKKIRSDENYMDATAKAAKLGSFEIEVLRAGKTIKLNVPTMFRPAYAEVTIAKKPVVTAVMQPMIDTMSVADEIAKLAKLRSDGLITEEEFNAQKLKLLAR